MNYSAVLVSRGLLCLFFTRAVFAGPPPPTPAPPPTLPTVPLPSRSLEMIEIPRPQYNNSLRQYHGTLEHIEHGKRMPAPREEEPACSVLPLGAATEKTVPASKATSLESSGRSDLLVSHEDFDGSSTTLNVHDLLKGTTQKIKFPGEVRGGGYVSPGDLKLSADGQFLAVSTRAGIVRVSLKDGKSQVIEFTNPRKAALDAISPDGKQIAYRSQDKTLVRDMTTGKDLTVAEKSDVDVIRLANDKAVVLSDGGGVKVFDLATGKETPAGQGKYANFQLLNGGGGYFSGDHEGLEVRDFKGKVIAKSAAMRGTDAEPGEVEEGGAGGNTAFETVLRRYVAARRAGRPGTTEMRRVLDLARSGDVSPEMLDRARTILDMQLNPGANPRNDDPLLRPPVTARLRKIGRTPLTQSPDGGKAAFTRGNDLVIFDLKTGKEKVVKGAGHGESIRFSPNGKFLTLNARRTDEGSDIDAHVFAVADDGTLSKRGSFTGVRDSWVDDKGELRALRIWGRDKYTISHWKNPQSLCVGKDPAVVKPSLPKDRAARLAAVMKDAQDTGLCAAEMNPKQWDAFVKRAPAGSEDEALRRLVRIGKSGGFSPNEDAQFLMSAIHEGYLEAYPDLAAGALQTVAAEHNLMYEEMVRIFSYQMEKLRPHPEANYCRSADEKIKLTDVAKAELDKLFERFKLPVGNALGGTEMDDWSSLSPLIPLLTNLKPGEKTKYHGDLAQSLADRASARPDFEQVGKSKLYRFAAAATNPFFGEPIPPIGDVHVIDSKDEAFPLVLASQPINGDEMSESRFGFYSKRLPAVKLGKEKKTTAKVEWKQGDDHYSVDVMVEAQADPRRFVPKAIKHDELRTGGVLQQLFVVGTNKYEDQDDVMSQAVEYYEGEGYDFESVPPKPVTDMNQEFESLIKGGVKVLMKASHGGGDEYPMMRVFKGGEIITGVKKDKAGKVIEKVYLYKGKKGTGEAVIRNDEFGKLLASRQGDAKGQFVYVNESCWSKDQTRHAIPAVQSPDYYPIVTLGCAYQFQNQETNAVRTIIHGIRERQDWSGIRDSLKTNGVKNYRIIDEKELTEDHLRDRYAFENDNMWVFPGEPAYGVVEALMDQKVKGTAGVVKVTPAK